MNKIDPNINSVKINLLSVIKPDYKDKTIDDIYIVRGEEEYIYGKGYIENHDVIVVKRITPDLVRKFAYSFNSKIEAVDFMRSLYQLEDVEAHLQEEEIIMDKDIDAEEKACTVEVKEPTNKNFSFGDDDEVNYRREMNRLIDKPIPVRETNINQHSKVKIDKGIF